MRQTILFRSHVKIEEGVLDHHGPDARRVGFDSSGTEVLVFSGVLKSDANKMHMAKAVTFADSEVPAADSPEDTGMAAGAPSAQAGAPRLLRPTVDDVDRSPADDRWFRRLRVARIRALFFSGSHGCT